MIDSFAAHVDRVLLSSGRTGRERLLATIWGGLVYGAVMGSFGFVAGERSLQVLYSAVKVPLLLGTTTLIALPSYFVVNTIGGLRNDFAQALRALFATQAAVSVILASLAPFTAVFYLCQNNYHEATIFNGIMFFVASMSGQWVLRRHYATLIAGNRRHRTMLRLWIGLYSFVGIQMGWVLRPFIGDPGAPTTFFRESAWGNAYVIVCELVWRSVKELMAR